MTGVIHRKWQIRIGKCGNAGVGVLHGNGERNATYESYIWFRACVRAVVEK
jgi:hypothetical protein